MEEKLDLILKKLESFETGVKSELKELKTDVKDLRERVTGLEKGQEEIKEKVTGLEKGQVSLEKGIAELKKQALENLDMLMAEDNSIFHSLSDKLDNLSFRVVTLETVEK